MSKYHPLQEHLSRQSSPRLQLTFSEIEEIIGHMLPPSAYAPRWWTNGKNQRPAPLWQDAWRSAGYEAQLRLGHDVVEFRRAEEQPVA